MTREEFLEMCNQFSADNPDIGIALVIGEPHSNNVQCLDSETLVRNVTLPQACELIVMLGACVGNHICGGVFEKGIYDEGDFPDTKHGLQ